MNGLFGFGWIDTLVKLIIVVIAGIIILLCKRDNNQQGERVMYNTSQLTSNKRSMGNPVDRFAKCDEGEKDEKNK